MLRALRDGAKSGILKFILLGFLFMAVGGLVMMDVQGFFRGGVSRNTVAKIDGKELGAMNFDLTVRRVLSQQNLTQAQAYQFGFIDQILNSEITNNLLQKNARDLGIYISDDQVAEQLNNIIAPLANEDMPNKEVLRRILLSQGMTEKELVEAMRADAMNAALRNALQEGTGVTPPQEVRDLYRYRNEERTIRTIMLPHDGITDIEPAEEKVLQALYEAGKERNVIPETRSFSMVVLTEDILKDTMDISEEELRQYYDDNINAFKLPEQRVIEQVIVSSRSIADNIIERVGKGADLLSALEEETGSDEGYVGQETFNKEGLTETVAEAAFNKEAGEVAGPVQTALGWHVMVIHEIRPPSTQDFADVRKSIKDDMMQMRLMDQMFALANNVDDDLAGGASLEDVAGNLDVKIRTFGPVRYDGSTLEEKDALADFENDREYIMDTVFEILAGEVAPVMELSDGSFVVIRTDEIREKSYIPFEELKADLAAMWMQDKRELANKQRAQDLLMRLQNGETTLEKAAAKHDATVKTLENISRADPATESLPATAKTKFFNIGENHYAVSQLENGFLIGQVTAISLPDPESITAKDLEKTAVTARRGAQDEFFLMYLKHLRERHKVIVNKNLLDQMYGMESEQM